MDSDESFRSLKLNKHFTKEWNQLLRLAWKKLILLCKQNKLKNGYCFYFQFRKIKKIVCNYSIGFHSFCFRWVKIVTDFFWREFCKILLDVLSTWNKLRNVAWLYILQSVTFNLWYLRNRISLELGCVIGLRSIVLMWTWDWGESAFRGGLSNGF